MWPFLKLSVHQAASEQKDTVQTYDCPNPTRILPALTVHDYLPASALPILLFLDCSDIRKDGGLGIERLIIN